MKISKLLNKFFNLIYFTFFFLISLQVQSNEPADIWNLKQTEEKIENNVIEEENVLPTTNSIEAINQNNIFEEENLLNDKLYLVGLYDPEENNLNIDMWLKSDGKEIKSILNKINKMDLSKDSSNILDIILLTNSYFPEKNISSAEFLEFKSNFLIQNNNLNLIKNYIIKNNKAPIAPLLVKYYLNQYLSNSDLEKACEIFNEIDIVEDDYLSKFKIYCLINENKKEEAQLIFDLKKELGFEDKFFENKFYVLMGYDIENQKVIADSNLLDFHLSHRTNINFSYNPNENTSKNIWKYLSSSNLLEKIDLINLEDIEKIKIIEKATHEKNYTEEELFELYKRFQFNINQLITVKDTYKLMPTYEGRALLYQRLILTIDPKEKLDLSFKLKKSFIDEGIENAFSEELSKILNTIEFEQVPSNYSTFYQKNLISKEEKKKNIKFDNKFIHQSKLLEYFLKNVSKEKTEKDVNDLLKKIKKNKKYAFSTKDIILLDSLKSDGIKISSKYDKLYDSNPNIPPDIQAKIQNEETAMVLLRIVEIIGEDELENIGSESLYFIISILNQLDMDKLRNRILIKVLPLKV